jgi:hypothetical protein
VCARALVAQAETAFADARNALRRARHAVTVSSGEPDGPRLAARAVAGAVLLNPGELPGSGPEPKDELRNVGEAALADAIALTRSGLAADDWVEALDNLQRALDAESCG